LAVKSEFVYVDDLGNHVDRQVTVRGWLTRRRSSGKIRFLVLRDGTGEVQCVAAVGDVSAEDFERLGRLPLESSLAVTGTVRVDKRSAGGHELGLQSIEVIHEAGEYPIQPKEHGVEFLFDQRHLYLRSRRPRAVLRVRHEVVQACRDYFYDRGYVNIDSPILTPAACEGTSTLFETEYFGTQAYLAQSGQLYLEPACMAFGKVYCFGPTFRAEKAKTRRHLTEFWMIEPEVAFMELPGLLELAEDFVSYVVGRVVERCRTSLEDLERDLSKLQDIVPPFPRLTYDEAAEILTTPEAQAAMRDAGAPPFERGNDFGGFDETFLTQRFERPVMVTHWPAEIKAFYMQPATTRRCNRPVFLCSAASSTAWIDSSRAGPMNEQVLTTITSAWAGSRTNSQPSAARWPSITSLSTRFLAQPRLIRPSRLRLMDRDDGSGAGRGSSRAGGGCRRSRSRIVPGPCRTPRAARCRTCGCRDTTGRPRPAVCAPGCAGATGHGRGRAVTRR
jgi:asparaginyl-tRNA synthetase